MLLASLQSRCFLCIRKHIYRLLVLESELKERNFMLVYYFVFFLFFTHLIVSSEIHENLKHLTCSNFKCYSCNKKNKSKQTLFGTPF
ncbi:hypothetical protein METBIDRAFT_153919 [Metschnikowia bicuspidata var. bicuspidata NRRL YB-4993]|uniref:Uncharacterized protein n=1 Tax=Metschnikowia bicuspidata var. bicuspidata NRRL YB-4993 TaxID=869754 RepID=A0A1A0HEY7_9ASCO|nr:hypothetical protein METBIDRAFT_153919 [Metschnikowia bicuspidata var. bicuspidata NRRL YB-4993]OBA22473.1 hypothetical protein METBIDRAFT_153919 [Metschnikowia bicuspidata var. bicuspidata NRRL YB-4993]